MQPFSQIDSRVDMSTQTEDAADPVEGAGAAVAGRTVILGTGPGTGAAHAEAMRNVVELMFGIGAYAPESVEEPRAADPDDASR